ncbi:MAG: YabP/YqfC family sporulation protein [Eubacteriales bacterium]
MAYRAEEKIVPTLPHNLSLEGRSRLKLEGITAVPRFDDTTVVLETSQGALVIHGADLHLGLLSLDNGKVAVDGTIRAMVYQDGAVSGGFFRRLLG